MDTTYQTTYYTTSSNLDSSTAGALLGVLLVIYLVGFVLTILMIVAMWRLFAKAGKPGWAAIIPIYNTVVMLEVIGRPVWWIFLLLVPFLQIWISIVITLDFVKAYGRSVGMGVLAIFFPYIAYPIMGFGKTTYRGPIAEGYSSLSPAPDRDFTAQSTPPVPPVPPAPAS